ncbi:MAG: ABC transporter permease [Proteobacteria bacterium]|nr:ABC transporter permease [Pseudomonadota bacterium]
MNYSQYLRQALDNLLSAKLRTFLAMLGILVGTASVVALVSSGQSATEKALQQFKALGTNLFAVSFYQSESSGNSAGSSEEDKISLEQVYKLKAQIKGIKGVSPYISLYRPINFLGHNVNGNIIGVTETLQRTIRINLMSGRFISFLDRYSYFCVIGNKIYQDLQKLGVQDPIGKQIHLGENMFTIVGVAEKWQENSFFNQDVNGSILIPLQASYILSKNASIQNIVLRVDPKTDIPELQDQINAFVERNVPGNKTFYRSAKEVINTMKEQNQIFTLLLGFIGGISLLVGGIGVMNVMLVSVAERRREIGIRMAIGARRNDIRMMFLFESIVLSLLGGVVGVVAGIVISNMVAFFAGWGVGIFIFPVILGFFVAAATGIFFGYYPAYRASQLDPIETLRYE